MTKLIILGSTGSIGRSAVQIISTHQDVFQVDLLVAGSNASLLAQQILSLKPRIAGLADTSRFPELCVALGIPPSQRSFNGCNLISGEDEILSAVADSDATIALASVVGMAGLTGVLAALESGKDVALANKESLVVAGELVVQTAARHSRRLIPVDSEHSAIFQALQGVHRSDLSSVILTASGGPFLRTPATEFDTITAQQALEHPNWSMGAKISVDSSTLMNKALEVIEARWLFDLSVRGQIEVIVHPQSIVHSLIRLTDGGLLAQLSNPDMRGPIAYALTYPNARLPAVTPKLELATMGALTFEEVDCERFPSIGWAFDCLSGTNGMSAVFNTANEFAVSEFLNCRLGFSSIFRVVYSALDRFSGSRYHSLADLLKLCSEVDQWLSEGDLVTR
jgi:1-deoxy-D-xylulose-5-phosphate reductoisomerase